MKCLLTSTVTILLSISTFAQIENFSWLVSREGHTTEEVSEVYPNGSIISAGSFFSHFDGDPGLNQITFTAPQFGTSSFVQKLNPDGSLAWVNEYNGDQGTLQLRSICIDVFGNSFITGNLNGLVDFDPNTPGFELADASNDIFILSLDNDGNFRWVVKLGGSPPDVVKDIKTDASGNVYFFGSLYYDNTDFDPGVGNVQLPSRYGYTSFVEKLSNDGDFIWAKRTIGRNRGMIEIDDASNVYILNTLNEFAITDAGDTLDSNVDVNILIQKLSSSGSQEWIRKYGNDVMLGVAGIAIDEQMNIYCQVNYAGDLNVDPGYSELTLSSSSYDVFIQKLNSDGSMIWTKSFGGPGTELARDITVSSDNHIYSIGSFVGDMDFISTSTEDNLNATLHNDGYFAKFDSNGDFLESHQFGNEHEDYGEKIHCDNSNHVFVHGRYNGEFTMNTTQGERVVFPNGNHFIMKYGDPVTNSENHLYIGLSPNPVENIVSVNQLDASEYAQLGSAIEIRIYDDMGRIILETTSNTIHTEIDLSEYRIGTYMIEVRKGDKFFMERVVKTGK